VRFGGIIEMLRPKVDSQPFPANLITIHFAFHSMLQARVDIPGTISISRGYDVEIHGSVTLMPIINIQHQQLFLGINTSSVVFAPFTASPSAALLFVPLSRKRFSHPLWPRSSLPSSKAGQTS
jgi:hypothetical protein